MPASQPLVQTPASPFTAGLWPPTSGLSGAISGFLEVSPVPPRAGLLSLAEPPDIVDAGPSIISL